MSQQINKELSAIQEEINKFNQLAKLSHGDIISITTGEKFKFTALKRKYFTGISLRDDKPYKIPVSSFSKLVEKNNEPTNEGWKNLKTGELFYIIKSNNALLFKFTKLTKKGNRVVILADNVASKVPTSIDVSLYGGKVSDL